MKWLVTVAATTLVLIAGSGEARAEEAFTPRAAGSRVGLSVDLWPTSDFTIVTMGIGGQIGITKHIGIDVDVPWAFGGGRVLGTLDTKPAIFGNPTLGAHGVVEPTRDLAVNFGFSVTIPTHYDMNTSSAVLLTAAAMASRGLADVHRFQPEAVFFRWPLGVELRIARVFYYRGELTPTAGITVGGRYPGEAAVLLQHADEIEWRSSFGLGGGLRFQAAFVLTGSGFGGDRAQTALEPFVGYEPAGPGVYARVGLLCALDTPFGFGFDRDKLAAVRMEVGGKF